MPKQMLPNKMCSARATMGKGNIVFRAPVLIWINSKTINKCCQRKYETDL
jgi:hypothetical protein